MREEKDAAAARKRQKEAAATAKKAEAEAAARRPRSATGHLLESGPNPGRMGRNSPMLIVYDRDGQVCVLGRWRRSRAFTSPVYTHLCDSDVSTVDIHVVFFLADMRINVVDIRVKRGQ